MSRNAAKIALIAGLMMSGAAHAAEVPVFSGVAGSFNVAVTSIKEARFEKVIKQQYDFSCGSAALATLLTYHYELPIGEDTVFTEMYKVGNQEKIRKEGFSLLDMKKFLKSRGFEANGFKTSLDKLAGVGVPAIVLINTNGYRHFVVIKGVSESEVLVGDPALGTRTYKREAFEEIWNEIFFVVKQNVDVARNYFNQDGEWSVRAKAPFGTALNRSTLAATTIMLPQIGDF